MQRHRRASHACDELDAAALWPCTAQIAGVPLPEAPARAEPEASESGRLEQQGEFVRWR